MMMETIKMGGNKLTSEERETLLNFDSIEKVWVMDSFVPKHFRKAIKQGWTPIKEYVYEDGTVFGMTLTAPEKAVSIRNVNKKKLSEKQLSALNGDG
jgi:hypothetical protein